MNILDLDTPEKIDEIIPDTDIIIGSPPCVSFSNSNKSGKADKTLGIQLINQYLKIILHKKTKPGSILKYWIMENVPNSLNYVKNKYSAEELGLNPNLPDLIIPEKLQKPIDLQFFIEILKLKYDIYLQVFPTKNNKIIKANIEIDKKDLYYNIEFKLRNYIKKHYI